MTATKPTTDSNVETIPFENEMIYDFADVATILDEKTSEPISPARPETFERIDATFAELERLQELFDLDDEQPEPTETTETTTAGQTFKVPGLDFQLPIGFCLSVIVPVYGPAPALREVIGRLRELPMPLDIVVVDDGRDDAGRDSLRQISQYHDVRIVYWDGVRGRGEAVRVGMQHAKGDVIAIQDADLRYDPRDLPRMVRPIVQDEADVVYGARQGKAMSLVRRTAVNILTFLSNLRTGQRLSDMMSGYKVFRRNALENIEMHQNGFGFEAEMTAKLTGHNQRLAEVPIHYRPSDGQTPRRTGIGAFLHTLYCIFRYGRRSR